MSELLSTPPSVPLSYTIARATPHSGNYIPDNIILDKPQDKFSRWSGALEGSNTKQWILLRLDMPAILKTITFGKVVHPCNMKEFKVYVGLTEDNMTEILHAGLKNDNISETFPLRYLNSAEICFPTRYIKILPILAHGGHKFHISIWHVSMTGVNEPTYVQKVLNMYEEHRETAALKHILKHLRQRRLLTPFNSILSRTSLQFEHPLVTKLYMTLVLRGDWEQAESLLQELSSSGLFSSHLSTSQPYAVWHRLVGTNADGDFHAPKARGGHAMCIDPENENIYVFGGWDGERSLDDFWMYSINDDRWTLLSPSTRNENNAPGPRSCHKMVFDTKTGSIYLLGRLSDIDGKQALAASRRGRGTDDDEAPTPTSRGHFSEFYRYHTRGLDRGKWDFLSFDTATSGGPPLMFDHQMVMDCESQMLYVFGGRIIEADHAKFSGLYSYNVRTSKWKLLHSNSSQVNIPSRYGHSMVLDPKSKILFIFAGQSDRYLSDMYAYDITTNTAVELFSNFSKAGGPDPCFTQRAVIDPELKEIFVYVFCGLTQGIGGETQNILRSYSNNWVYRYHSRPGQWVPILREPEHTTSARIQLPVPRFAHQVVYNPKTRSVYMHGGNAGGLGVIESNGVRYPDGDAPNDEDGTVKTPGSQERRLDDFWRMDMRRPGPEEVIRRSIFHIRRQQFREMCEDESLVKTLKFLQTDVAQVVDHMNASEEETFRSLLTHLLSRPPPPESPTTPSADSSESGSWTSKISEGDLSSPSTPVENVNVNALWNTMDPLELQYTDGRSPPSATHYAQRMEVFEDLLEYISESDKEPSGSLLDIVEREGTDKERLEE
ncbi:Muskelin N-terminus-domain-containing protein [Cyathus striatus]|nr:Muskelin N-terminus-domain-containing protein [Cyathus striatus]